MYKVPVEVAASTIEGKGVFASADINEGTLVWVITEGHDILLKSSEYDALPEERKDSVQKTGYLSPWSNQWVFPPDNDPAQFTNHSSENNLSAIYDSGISPEPFFRANRDIKSGEELTNNYLEFDKITQDTKPDWAV